MSVLAATHWTSNAHMIEAVAEVHLDINAPSMDATYGLGVWWKRWRPTSLVTHDLHPIKGDGVDFRNLPEADETYGMVALDGPYKLNGTPDDDDAGIDGRFGVNRAATVAERHQLIFDGIDECGRVLQRGGILLVKGQDQVCNGRMYWQGRLFTEHAIAAGFVLLDEAFKLGHVRTQPARTRKPTRAEMKLGMTERQPSRQQHLARNYSTLLILRKKHR